MTKARAYVKNNTSVWKSQISTRLSQENMNFIIHISSTALTYSNVYLKNQIIEVLDLLQVRRMSRKF